MLHQSLYETETVFVSPQYYVVKYEGEKRVVILQYLGKERFNTSISEWHFN